MAENDIIDFIRERLDRFENKIDDLCDRTIKTETKLSDYLSNEKEKAEKKDRNYRLGFGILGGIFGFYAIIKEFFL